MTSTVATWILRIAGWRIRGSIPASLNKYVVIVAPHTSGWDIVLGVLVRAAIRRRIGFLAKKSLFGPPLGWLTRWLGGYPVDRSVRTRLVDQVVKMFEVRDRFAIAIAPEGTRAKVVQLRTGFYYIARGARIPIIMASLDYGNKVVAFSAPFHPSDNIDADLSYIRDHFKGVRGYHPEMGLA